MTEGADHDPAAHMDAHAAVSDDDHGHEAEALGSIDWRSWAAALIGVASGVVVLAAFWVAVV